MIELPPKYYLSHFQELIFRLQTELPHLLQAQHQQLLQSFHELSENAQCLYVRMVNRKGQVFLQSSLCYQEIENFPEALRELQQKAFARRPQTSDVPAILKLLTKPQLSKLLTQQQIRFEKQQSKDELLTLARDLSALEIFEEQWLEQLIVQEKNEELSYLLFLYFGKLQQNLTLYTLRDLGIRKTNNRQSFSSKFKNLSEAQSHYFYAHTYQRYFKEQGLPRPMEIHLWPPALNTESKNIREELLISLAEKQKKEGQLAEALSLLEACQQHPGREKRVRLLYQLNLLERCQQELSHLLTHPFSDEEYLFAEDFQARKFQQRKLSLLTQTLRDARKLEVDESYFRQPEAGVIQLFKEQGITAFHTENYLWNALFGIIFWHELFESERTQTHNQFDRIPHELTSREFYDNHQSEIQHKLKLLENPPALHQYIVNIFETKTGEINGVFGWGPELKEQLELFLEHAPTSALMSQLIYMAQDYVNRSSGFPDLMSIENGRLAFYEVKAEGDSLKTSQLKQIVQLQKAGFHIEVLQVHYNVNPDQPYVVVDLETTGGRPGYHRITEIGAIKIQNGRIVDQFQTLINPQRSIPWHIQQFTGITNEMVAAAPTFAEVAQHFLEFTKDSIFVAHNVAFDYGFLQAEYEKLEQRFTRPYICTKAGMKKYYPGLESYSLKSLTSHFAISLENHHRALNDAQAAAQLLLLINERRRKSSAQVFSSPSR